MRVPLSLPEEVGVMARAVVGNRVLIGLGDRIGLEGGCSPLLLSRIVDCAPVPIDAVCFTGAKKLPPPAFTKKGWLAILLVAVEVVLDDFSEPAFMSRFLIHHLIN